MAAIARQLSVRLPATTRPRLLDVSARRTFFAYFRIAFNSVDTDRLKTVGPDRLCAEWLLKNGGSVTFAGGMCILVHSRWENNVQLLPCSLPISAGSRAVFDYNMLGAVGPTAASPRIVAIDATDASIMAIGFDHLHGCTQVQRIRLCRCKHMESEALAKLADTVGATLRELHVEECYNVTDEGLLSLGALSELRSLTVCGVPYVKDVDGVRSELTARLSKDCEISISK